MNKHLTALVIKFIVIGLVSVIILPMFGSFTSGQAVLTALVLTLVAYFFGDLFILSSYGNVTAVIVDVITAALVIGVADLAVNGIITLNAAGWILALALLAVGEWFFHKYMAVSPVRVTDDPGDSEANR
jgi:hypothetical protein